MNVPDRALGGARVHADKMERRPAKPNRKNSGIATARASTKVCTSNWPHRSGRPAPKAFELWLSMPITMPMPTTKPVK
ncbi:MAG: hypothetical protein ABL955_03965 [Elusimicrobiota bacterium]